MLPRLRRVTHEGAEIRFVMRAMIYACEPAPGPRCTSVGNPIIPSPAAGSGGPHDRMRLMTSAGRSNSSENAPYACLHTSSSSCKNAQPTSQTCDMSEGVLHETCTTNGVWHVKPAEEHVKSLLQCSCRRATLSGTGTWRLHKAHAVHKPVG